MVAWRSRYPACSRLAVVALGLLPQAADACEACFGSPSDSGPVTHAIKVAMLGLVAVTGCVLGSIVFFFAHLRRRETMIASGRYIVSDHGFIVGLPKGFVARADDIG